MKSHIAGISLIAVMSVTLDDSSISAEATAARLKRDELMPLIFPSWSAEGRDNSSGGSKTYRFKLSSLGDSAPIIAEGEVESLDPHPLQVIRLDNEHAVLITGSDLYVGDGDQYCLNYGGCPIIIGAYFFEQSADGWTPTIRFDNLALEYGFTSVGVRNWPGHGFLLSVNSEDSAQGGSRKDIDFVLLQANSATTMHVSIGGDFDGGRTVYEVPSSDTNRRETGEAICGDFMRTSFHAPEGAIFDETSVDTCTQTRGKWRLESDRIRLTYRILRRTFGPLQHVAETIQTADVAEVDGVLKVVTGSIPEISTT